MVTSNLNQQKDLLAQTNVLEKQIQQIENKSLTTTILLCDLKAPAQVHIQKLQQINIEAKTQWNSLTTTWPSQPIVEIIEPFIKKVTTLTGPW